MKVMIKEMDFCKDGKKDYKVYAYKNKEELEKQRELKKKCDEFTLSTGVAVNFNEDLSEFVGLFIINNAVAKYLTKNVGGLEKLSTDKLYEFSINEVVEKGKEG